MRIDPSERAGHFWLPETPERQLPGTLKVSPGGRIELEVLGLFGGPDTHMFEEVPAPRIVGVTEKWGAVTLDRCFEIGRASAAGGITKTRIFAHLLVAGLLYGADEPLIFERFQFSLDGLNDWLCFSGIKVSHDLNARSSSYTYQPQEEIAFELTPNIDGALGFSYSLPGGPIDGKVTLTERAVFSLLPAEPTSFEELTKTAQRIAHFFCFATDQTVSMNTVRAQSPLEQVENRSDEDTHGPLLSLVFQSLPYTEQLPRYVQNTMLFRFPQIRDQVDKTFSRWISTYEVIQPALDLYFSVRTGAYKYTEGRFLSLAQAIETLHRRTSDETALPEKDFSDRIDGILAGCPDPDRKWLKGRLAYANELSLRNRIKRMIKPFSQYFGDSKETNTFVSNVVSWRNYLTHYDAENQKAQVSKKELFPLCMKMEALLQLHWLTIVGFDDASIKNIVSNSPALKEKLHGKPGFTA